MKKFLSGCLLASLFLLIIATSVYASGYVDPTVKPHGGFTTTTNFCKNCHAVHLATGTYRILRADDAATACDYCHGQTGITSKKTTLDTEGHGLTAAQVAGGTISPPDETSVPVSFNTTTWGCPKCHSVHDSNTVILSEQGETSSSKLLKKFPNPSKVSGSAFYDGTTGTLSYSQWCTNCHEANYGLHTQAKTVGGADRYGHDSSAAGLTLSGSYAAVNPSDGLNNGPKCRQCHQADRAILTYGWLTVAFPHAGGDSWKMLKTGVTGGPISSTALDNVCRTTSCHDSSLLP